MLLLVLILVLLAFALLVVALLSGSVLAAWVSVGLSVVAAVVLLVDWLQRRAAVRAGEASLLSGDTGPARGPEPSRANQEPDPATEVLPVVSSGGPSSGAAEARQTGAGSAAPASSQLQDPAAGEPVSLSHLEEPTVDGAQSTVFIAPVQPSGSSSRPPGAGDGITSSSAFSSPSVNTPGAENGSAESSNGSSGAAAEPLPLVDTRKKVDTRKASVPAASVPAGSGSGDPVDPAAATADHRNASGFASEPAAAPVSGAPAAGAPTGAAEAGGSTSRDGAAAGSQQAGQAPVRSSLSGSDLFGGDAPPAVPEPVAEAPTAGEPPEEQANAAARSLVAGLDDEVVVIDEQPRYHVSGCRSLAAQTPIPLPAREAVELGFTPCGWCSPDRTLAERHPAAAR